MSTETKDRKEFYAKDRKAWRKWLEKNHEQQDNVWLLIHHQKSATPSVYYAEAVEEALCFGWIDSRPNKRDDESFFLFFSKRKPKSNWSALNKTRVARLMKEGLITPAGLAMIELAKKTGTWEALEKVDNETIPTDLKKAFAANKEAKKNFTGFPPSARKMLLQWLPSAKTEATRNKRIEEIVSKAAQNIRANQYVPKNSQ